jgi:hypothetical protein
MSGSGLLSSNGRDQTIARNAHMAGYVAYYRCFHTRYIELGPTDPLTIEAQQLVLTFSTLGGERLVSAMELKLRVAELQWTCTNTTNWLYSVALFVGRLKTEDALTLRQVRLLVTNAIRFSDSKLNSGQRANGGSPDASPTRQRPNMPHTPTSPNKFSRSMEDLSLRSPSTEEGPDVSEGVDSEQVQVITSMLMMIPKPFLVPALSPSKRSEAASPVKTPQGERGLPKLRVYTPGLSGGRSALSSPAAAEHSSHPNSNMSSHADSPWALRDPAEASTEPVTPGAHESKVNAEGTGSGEVADTADKQTDNTGADSPSKFQSKLKAAEVENASPTRALPENWKPLKSAYASMAWTSCHHIQSVDFAIGLAESVYARDKEGVLLVLRRALGDTVEEARRNEALAQKQARKSIRRSAAAAGSSNSASATKRVSVKSTASVGSAGASAGDGADPTAALNALFGKRAPPGAAAVEDASAGDPKAKLNALFSKQGGGLKLGGPPPSGVAAGEDTVWHVLCETCSTGCPDCSLGRACQLMSYARAPPLYCFLYTHLTLSSLCCVGPVGGAGAGAGSSGPVWATDVPPPPPIPTAWPPEPYTGDVAASAAEGASGATAGADGAPAGAVSTIVNADGTVVTITLPAAAPAPKAKLKQIYLVNLPAIENTLWADTGEELISVSYSSSRSETVPCTGLVRNSLTPQRVY